MGLVFGEDTCTMNVMREREKLGERWGEGVG